ncbi:MAG: hypothetical protein HYZ38_22015 [Mycobacterium sp.]|nr:hypothetical protein [Mycobacterium sp.]
MAGDGDKDEFELAVELSGAAPTKRLLAAARRGTSQHKLMELATALTEIFQAASFQTLRAESPRDQGWIDLSMSLARKPMTLSEVLTSLISLRLTETHTSRYDSADFLFGSIVDPEGVELLENEIIPLRNMIPAPTIGSTSFASPAAFLEALRGFDNFLSTWCATYQSRAVALLREGVSGTKKLQMSVSYPPAIGQLLASSTVEQISELADTAQDKVDELADTLSDGGRLKLTEAFTQAQDDTKTLSKTWSVATFACVVVGVAISGGALLADAEVLKHLGGSSGLIIKGLTGVPFFVLSVFCGRVAGHYREVSRYLMILIAQLKTVAAYANNLEKTQRDELILKLGERAFANPSFTAQPAQSSVSVEDLKSLVDEFARVVRGVTGGDKKV